MSLSEKNRLFRKFLDGEISREEMHLLDQYALDDDFLFEALEGAAKVDDRSNGIMKDLEDRLERKNKVKRNPLYLWLSAAAMIAIVVVAIKFLPSPQNEMMSDVLLEKSEEVPEADSDQAEKKMIDVQFSAADEGGQVDLTPIEDSGASPPKPAFEELGEEEAASPKPEPAKKIVQTEALSYESEAAPTEEFTTNTDLEAGDLTLGNINKTIANEQPAVVEEELSDEEEVSLSTKARSDKDLRGRDQKSDDAAERKEEALEGISQEPTGKQKKRARSQVAPTSSSPAESLSEFSKLPSFKVRLRGDRATSEALQQYLSSKLPTYKEKRVFKATFTIQSNRFQKWVDVDQSIDPLSDEKIMQLIESFDSWEGSRNQKITILFNKE